MSEILLSDRVSQALEQNPHFKRRNWSFETNEGRVVLKGVVKTYFHKQMAQESLRGLEGVRQIENQLEVCW